MPASMAWQTAQSKVLFFKCSVTQYLDKHQSSVRVLERQYVWVAQAEKIGFEGQEAGF